MKKAILLLCIITVWFLFSICVPQTCYAGETTAIFPAELTGDQLYEQGLNLCNQEKYQEAIPYLEEAAKRKPDFGEAYYQLGDCYLKTKEFDKAKQNLVLAKTLSKDETLKQKAVEKLNRLKVVQSEGTSNTAAGERQQQRLIPYQYQQKIAECTKTVESNPNSADAYWSRALAWFALGCQHNNQDFQQAADAFQQVINDCTKVIELNPNNINILSSGHSIELKCNNADVYYKRGDAYRFLAYVKKHLYLLPSEPQAELKQATEDYQQAIIGYTKVIQLNPKDAYAYFSRGYARYLLVTDLAHSKPSNYQQELRQVKNDFTKFFELDPNNEGARRSYDNNISKGLKDINGQ